MGAKLFSITFLVLILMLLSAISASATMSNPSLCSGAWTDCANAFTDNGQNTYAIVTNAFNKSIILEGYNLTVACNSNIESLKIRADFFVNSLNTYTKIKVSRDGGITYGPDHSILGTYSETPYWIDITNDFPWTAPDLEKGKFKISATCSTLNGVNSRCKIEWIPVNISIKNSDPPVINQTNQTNQTTITNQANPSLCSGAWTDCAN